MHRVLRSLALAAIVTAIGGSAAWALSPDDAIYLTQQGVDDEVIIAKICADGEAWDLSSDDLVYLRDQYVDEDVIEALIDPASAANRYGFVLGDGDLYDDSYPRTAYVYSLGYYYGPIARSYFYDPFFYSYLYCDRFSFGFSYWPSYYASNCFPYYYGYYAYPYFCFPSTSFYYGNSYCGSYYDRYRTRYRDGYVAGGGNVRWRDWSNRSGSVSYGGGPERGYRQRGDWRTGDPQNGQRRLNDGEQNRNRTRMRDPIAYDDPARRIRGNRTWVPRGRDEVQRPRRNDNSWAQRGDNTPDPGQGSWRGPRIIRGGGSGEDRGARRTWNPDRFRRGNQPDRGQSPDRSEQRRFEQRRFDPAPGNGRGDERGWSRRGDEGSRGRPVEREPARAPQERSYQGNGRSENGRGDGGHVDNGHGWGQQDRGGEGRRR